MRSHLLMMGVLAAIGMQNEIHPNVIHHGINAGDGNRKHKPKSLKQFNVEGKIVWAINEKNAKRKAKIYI